MRPWQPLEDAEPSMNEEIPKTLERIHHSFPEGSAQQEAVRTAGAAYLFAMMYHAEEFTRFFETMNDPLNEEQRAHLRSLGLEP